MDGSSGQVRKVDVKIQYDMLPMHCKKCKLQWHNEEGSRILHSKLRNVVTEEIETEIEVRLENGESGVVPQELRKPYKEKRILVQNKFDALEEESPVEMKSDSVIRNEELQVSLVQEDVKGDRVDDHAITLGSKVSGEKEGMIVSPSVKCGDKVDIEADIALGYSSNKEEKQDLIESGTSPFLEKEIIFRVENKDVEVKDDMVPANQDDLFSEANGDVVVLENNSVAIFEREVEERLLEGHNTIDLGERIASPTSVEKRCY
ncbi:hypothetical protein K7X08_033967 [Anisodus acutangulus]|uniref:Uncharacterized protein n=1 Tax=Anisodus acutangulus TaxID=402998 RepID=A0A9Q1QXL7_9SOLA|nr:hypothetical protein K7X08_033967 [Anisodus acutangulus]